MIIINHYHDHHHHSLCIINHHTSPSIVQIIRERTILSDAVDTSKIVEEFQENPNLKEPQTISNNSSSSNNNKEITPAEKTFIESDMKLNVLKYMPIIYTHKII